MAQADLPNDIVLPIRPSLARCPGGVIVTGSPAGAMRPISRSRSTPRRHPQRCGPQDQPASPSSPWRSAGRRGGTAHTSCRTRRRDMLARGGAANRRRTLRVARSGTPCRYATCPVAARATSATRTPARSAVSREPSLAPAHRADRLGLADRTRGCRPDHRHRLARRARGRQRADGAARRRLRRRFQRRRRGRGRRRHHPPSRSRHPRHRRPHRLGRLGPHRRCRLPLRGRPHLHANATPAASAPAPAGPRKAAPALEPAPA